MAFLKTKISPLQNLKIEKSSDSARQKIIALEISSKLKHLKIKLMRKKKYLYYESVCENIL